MKEEYDVLLKNGTWSLVPRASNTNVVDGKRVYRLKREKNGAITRYKARFVAKGLRYTSHHMDHFTSESSSGHSSSDQSSSEHSTLGHSLPEHASPDTTVADSSTPPRFSYPPLARTPRCSEAYLRWRSAPLSTMYPLMTSESLPGDSSSESSVGPSCKRCRSSAATMTSYIHAMRALVPSCTDLLPSHIEADATAVEVAVDRDVVAGFDAGIDMEVDVGVDVEDEVEDEVESSDRGTMEVGVDVVVRIDIPDGMLMPDAVEHLEQVKEGLQDIYKHVIEIPLQRIEDIEKGQRELEARSLIDVKPKRTVTAIMGMVEMEMVEMEMVEMEMVEMEIQMRIIGVFAVA
ncbi:putative reverse transcriptase domain-containing protein [Tanacetum coccineum]